MEISKTTGINVDYKDRRTPTSWQSRLFAEVILIDKTHNALHPKIYQLKDNVVPTSHQILYWKSGAITLPDEAFVLVGEAQSIDRKKKEILLTNENTISYNYMIIASGRKPVFSFESEKFLAAIQALIEAIRVKQKIPSSFAKCIPASVKIKTPLFSIRPHQYSIKADSNTIDSIAQPNICQTFDHKLFGPDLRTINKRLYEVHL